MSGDYFANQTRCTVIFSSHSLAYLHDLICLHTTSVTPRDLDLTSEQILHVVLHFFYSGGRFLDNTDDGEQPYQEGLNDVICQGHHLPERSDKDKLFTFYLVFTITKAKVSCLLMCCSNHFLQFTCSHAPISRLCVENFIFFFFSPPDAFYVIPSLLNHTVPHTSINFWNSAV